MYRCSRERDAGAGVLRVRASIESVYREVRGCRGRAKSVEQRISPREPLSPLESRSELYRVCSVCSVSRYRGECWVEEGTGFKGSTGHSLQSSARLVSRHTSPSPPRPAFKPLHTLEPCFQGPLPSPASTLSSPAFKPLYPLYPTQRAIYIYIRLCRLFRYIGSGERERESRERE